MTIEKLQIHIEQRPPLEEHYTPFCQSEPAVQSHWSPSSLDLLQDCPRKYKYIKLDRWTARHEKDSLWFGKAFHAGVEFHTKRLQAGTSFDEALTATVRHLLHETTGHQSDDSSRTRTTLLRAVVWYLDEYRHSPIVPIRLQSGAPAVELEWELQLPLTSPDGDPYVLRGHFDEVASRTRRSGMGSDLGPAPDSGERVHFIIPERKTTGGSIGPAYMAGWKPHTQTASYSLAASVVFPEAFTELLIQACQTMVGGARFGIRSVDYSAAELEEFVSDTLEWIRSAERWAHINYWPMNRSSCGKFGGCAFRKVCERAPSVRPVLLASDFIKLPSVWEISAFRKFLSYL